MRGKKHSWGCLYFQTLIEFCNALDNLITANSNLGTIRSPKNHDFCISTKRISTKNKFGLIFMSNRVEHQNQNQPAIEKWPFGFVFGVQLGLRQTGALINTYHIILTYHHRHGIHHLSIYWKMIQLVTSWITFQ